MLFAGLLALFLLSNPVAAAPKPPLTSASSSAKEAILLQLTHHQPSQRLAAIEAIRKKEDPSLYPALLSRLEDPEPSVANRARLTLLTLGEAAVPALVAVFQTRQEPYFHQVLSLISAMDHSAMPVYAAAIELTHATVRMRALQNLRKVLRRPTTATREAVLLVTRVLATSPEPFLKEAALRALTECKNFGPDPISSLSLIVHDPLPLHRELTMDVLGRTGSPEALPLLGVGLRDPLRSVRQHAIKACYHLRSPLSVPYVIPSLQDEEMGIRYDAFTVLANTKSLTALPALEAAIGQDPAHLPLQPFFEMLMDPVFDDERLPALTRLVGHSAATVRTHTLNTLARLREHPARADYLLLVKGALQDPDSSIRGTAQRVLLLYGEGDDNPFSPKPSGE